MPKLFNKKLKLLLPCLYLLIVSCAGTDGSGVIGGATPTPTPNNITRGKITEVDTESKSIVVDGVTFQVDDNTIIRKNGLENQLEELFLNQVVTVKSNQIDSALPDNAIKISYLSNAIGSIDSIGLSDSHIRVLGQTYLVNSETIIVDKNNEQITMDDLDISNLVEISALDNGNGELFSTRVSVVDEISLRILFGTITRTHRDLSEFEINDMSVSYSDLDLPPEIIEGLQEGAEVFVLGQLVDDNQSQQLKALDLSLVNNEGDIELFVLSVRGIITEFESPSKFIISGNYTLSVSESTEFINGNIEDLDQGDDIQVVANYNQSSQQFDVTRLEFESHKVPTILDLDPSSEDYRYIVGAENVMFAPIGGVDVGNSDTDISVLGSIQILEQEYEVTSLFAFANSSDRSIDNFSEFTVGEWYQLGLDKDILDGSYSVNHVGTFREIPRVILIGELEIDLNGYLLLLGQHVLLTESSECFDAKGFEKSCQNILADSKLYVEASLVAPMEIRYVVELE